MTYTNDELKKAFGFPSKQKKLRKFVFEPPNERLEFDKTKQALEKLQISAKKIANASRSGKIEIENVEYDFKRE